jgi:hypothetical protein
MARRRSAHAQRRVRGSLRSRPTGVQTKPSDRTDPPDPRVRYLIAAFSQSHRDALGQPYLPAYGRDGACLKRALRVYDEPTIRRAMAAYFADRDARLRFGADIAGFVKRIGTLAAQSHGGSTTGFVG